MYQVGFDPSPVWIGTAPGQGGGGRRTPSPAPAGARAPCRPEPPTYLLARGTLDHGAGGIDGDRRVVGTEVGVDDRETPFVLLHHQEPRLRPQLRRVGLPPLAEEVVTDRLDGRLRG